MRPGKKHGEQVYLRSYQTDARTRRVVFRIATISVGFFLLIALLPQSVTGRPWPNWGLVWVDAVLAIAWLLIFSTYSRRVILYEDAVEVAG